VLINNIAWSLRHLPVFGVFGAGEYRLQPIYVDDLAQAAVDRLEAGTGEVVEAIGPETFTYRGLVERIRDGLSVNRPIVSVPPALGYWAGRLVGWMVRDVVITREEIQGLMENRLAVDAPPLGKTPLSDWIEHHRDALGKNYTSEMSRRRDRLSAYRSN
jgi:NADH dehydrogenase